MNNLKTICTLLIILLANHKASSHKLLKRLLNNNCTIVTVKKGNSSIEEAKMTFPQSSSYVNFDMDKCSECDILKEWIFYGSHTEIFDMVTIPHLTFGPQILGVFAIGRFKIQGAKKP